MGKQSERTATWEGRAVAYRSALERLMGAVRALSQERAGWDQVVDALAAADATLVRQQQATALLRTTGAA